MDTENRRAEVLRNRSLQPELSSRINIYIYTYLYIYIHKSITFKLENQRHKGNLERSQRRNTQMKHLTHRGIWSKNYLDFSSEQTVQAQRERSGIKMLKEKNHQSQILCPAKLYFKRKDK